MRVLVTGGAGFIGSHIVDALVARGDEVTVLDSLDEQVHPLLGSSPPDDLSPQARFIHGNVLDPAALSHALAGCDRVVHQAAAVGTAQSQYEIARYVETNTIGTARLMEAVVNHSTKVRKVVVAASMASYGEGAYQCASCGRVRAEDRPRERLDAQQWEPLCPRCDGELTALGIREDDARCARNIYALTKAQQEDLVLLLGRTYDIPAVALRYFNVYGPRQSLSNPYTGVAAIFLARLKCGRRPVIYEDGAQSRDFVSVHDIVRANLMALDAEISQPLVFNVGSGEPLTIAEIARKLAAASGIDMEPEINGRARSGDIRHCIADIDGIRNALGYSPQTSFDEGIAELIDWSGDVEAMDEFDNAQRQLEERGLV